MLRADEAAVHASNTTARWSTPFASACRTRQSARTSSPAFPAKRDEDFELLTAYLEQSPLTHLHVFPYSDRPGTVASILPGKVHGTVIKARARRLREISRVLADRFRDAQRGTRRPALTIEDGSVAVTDNYFRVPAPPGHARNEWVTAESVSVSTDSRIVGPTRLIPRAKPPWGQPLRRDAPAASWQAGPHPSGGPQST